MFQDTPLVPLTGEGRRGCPRQFTAWPCGQGPKSGHRAEDALVVGTVPVMPLIFVLEFAKCSSASERA